MGRSIYSYLLLLGAVVGLGLAVCPNKKKQQKMTSFVSEGTFNPYSVDPFGGMSYKGAFPEEDPVETEPEAEPDISDKIGRLTRSFNNLVRRTSSGAEMTSGGRSSSLAKVQETRANFIKGAEANLRKYQEEFNALNVGLVMSGSGANKNKLAAVERRKKDKIISKLVDAPKVQFFENEDFTGAYKVIELGAPEEFSSCKSLGSLRANESTIAALDTFGTCVRLFKGRGCIAGGESSLAVYPGLRHKQDLSSFLAEVKSVGPCYKSEFDYSSFTLSPQDGGSLSVTKDFESNLEIPSLLNLSPDHCSRESMTKGGGMDGMLMGSTKSIYGQDCSMRTSFFTRTLRIGDVNCQELDTRLNASEAWESMEKNAGDLMGFLISPNIGGCSQDPDNIFPQSLANFDAWNGVMERAVDRLIANPSNSVQVVGLLTYPNLETKRPNGLYWNLVVDTAENNPFFKSPDFSAYGYIPN